MLPFLECLVRAANNVNALPQLRKFNITVLPLHRHELLEIENLILEIADDKIEFILEPQ